MLDKKIDVLMSEMSAIRNEINTSKETIHSILNFFFVLIGAEVSLFVAIWDSSVDFNIVFIRLLILTIPVLFMCLSMYHSECVMRIHSYSNYVDSNIRGKIQKLLGEPLLKSKSKTPTKSIIGVFKESPIDAKLGYLSKLGIKAISMLLPILFYICMVNQISIKTTIMERIVVLIDIFFVFTLLFMQHD